MRLGIALVTLVSVVGCASSTVIRSVPPGARVYVNGHYLGEAPVTQTDKAVLLSSKTVVLKKEGYRDQTGTITKGLAIVPLLTALLCVVPLLWALGHPDEYVFDLEPIPAEQPPR